MTKTLVMFVVLFTLVVIAATTTIPETEKNMISVEVIPQPLPTTQFAIEVEEIDKTNSFRFGFGSPTDEDYADLLKNGGTIKSTTYIPTVQ